MLHPHRSPPQGREGGSQGAHGGHLTFSNGAVRGGGVVGEEEAGAVPAVAAPASWCDGALVLRGHGRLVNGRAVLVGQCSCGWIPIGAGVCIQGGQRRQRRVRCWVLEGHHSRPPGSQVSRATGWAGQMVSAEAGPGAGCWEGRLGWVLGAGKGRGRARVGRAGLCQGGVLGLGGDGCGGCSGSGSDC